MSRSKKINLQTPPAAHLVPYFGKVEIIHEHPDCVQHAKPPGMHQQVPTEFANWEPLISKKPMSRAALARISRGLKRYGFLFGLMPATPTQHLSAANPFVVALQKNVERDERIRELGNSFAKYP